MGIVQSTHLMWKVLTKLPPRTFIQYLLTSVWAEEILSSSIVSSSRLAHQEDKQLFKILAQV